MTQQAIRPWTRVVAFIVLALSLATVCHGQALELKKSTRASQRAYNAAVGIHNGQAWDSAATKWEAFLKEYPDDELSPQAQYYLGICFTQMQPAKLAPAVAAFAALQEKYPKFESMPDALLQKGYAEYQLAGSGGEGGYPAAEKTFTQLAAAGKADLVDDALYYQGEARYFQNNRKGAIESYQAVIDNHPESPLYRDALYALGVAQEEEKNYAAAGKVYDQFLAKYGEDESVGTALLTEIKMRKGETVLQGAVAAEEKDAQAAKKLFAEAEKLFAEAAGTEGFASADHATFRQALSASKQGKYEDAANLYGKVADNKDSVYVKEATMDAGRSYYQAKKFDDAAKRFRKVVESGGSDKPEAAHWLARVLIDHQKKYTEAAELAKNTLKDAKGSPFLVNLLMDQGDALFEQQGKQAEALPVFVSIATDHKDSPLAAQALYNAAFTARELKQYDDALKHATDFLASHADHALTPDVKYVAAESHLFKREYAEAEKLYAELIDAYPKHRTIEQWQLRHGLAAFIQNKYQETIDALSSVVGSFKSKNNIAEAQYYVGVSHYQLNKNQGNKLQPAIDALNASYAANPKWRRTDEVLLDLARAQSKSGKPKDAIANVKKMLAEFADSDKLDRAHFDLAQYSYDTKDYKTAATEYAKVATDSPDSIFAPHALYGQGWSEVRQGNDKAATASFSTLLEKHADHRLAPDAHYARAVSRQRLGEYAGDIEDINAFLESKPDKNEKCDALYNRGLCEAGLKKWADAAKTYEEVLTVDAKYSGADKVLYELAWAYKEQKKEEQALKNFKALAENHADSPLAAEAFYHVGEQQYSEEEYEQAAASFAKAKAQAKKPDLAETSTYKLGWSHYRQEDYEQALAAFNDQVNKHAQGKLVNDALLMVGECHFKQENFDEAVTAFDKALAAESTSDNLPFYLLHAGQAAAQTAQPNWTKSVELLTRLKESYPDSPFIPQTLYELGWASFNLSKQDEAIDYFDKTADHENTSDALFARSKFMMGEVKFAKKDFKGALPEYLVVVLSTGGENAPDEVKPWIAKAALQAAQVASVMAGQEENKAKKDKLIADAKKYLNIVITQHADSEVATAAQAQLKRLGG